MKDDKLQAGLAELNLTADSGQVEKMLSYLALLQKWNKAYNLTSIKDPNKMVAYHLLDSLAISKAIPDSSHCLDVGTGAGLPGIPLAIMMPKAKWVLLDSNGKKTRFVQQAIASCGLSNVKVVQTRVQDYHAVSPFDVIVSRAYASLQDFISSVDHLWQTDARLITMKTELSKSELQEIDEQLFDLDISQLQVPGIPEKRSLALIVRKNIQRKDL